MLFVVVVTWTVCFGVCCVDMCSVVAGAVVVIDGVIYVDVDVVYVFGCVFVCVVCCSCCVVG